MSIFNGYTSKASAIRDLRAAGFTFSTALGATESNPKLVKGEKLGVLSKPHNLSPASESGWNMCAQASLGCIAACLHTAGNPVYLAAKIQARSQRTRAFMTMRKTYVALMAFELQALELKAKRLNMVPAWRPNTTSDYPFHTVALTVNGKPCTSLLHAFPDIEAYDYTKITKKALQWAVFEKALPDTWQGVKVINGDESDVRFMDEIGVVVGLKAKGEGKKDQSGFVIRQTKGLEHA